MNPHRCERNIAGREEDCGSRVAYVKCGKPANWLIDDTHRGGGWQACEEHALEALRAGSDEVTGMFDGEPMTIDAEGEIAVAS